MQTSPLVIVPDLQKKGLVLRFRVVFRSVHARAGKQAQRWQTGLAEKHSEERR